MTYHITTASELMAISDGNRGVDVVEQILVIPGYGLLGGVTGIGKTNELIHLWLCFASKTQAYYHGLKVKPCHAIYINCEDGAKRMGKRLKKISPQYDVAYDPKSICADNIYLDTAEGERQLRNIVNSERANGFNVEVVLIDSLKYACCGDYQKPMVARSWANRVKQICTDLNVAIIFSCHTRKLVYYQGKVEDIYNADRLKGAKDLIDGAQSGLLFAECNRSTTKEGTRLRIKTSTLVPVKTRDAECNLEYTYLELTFDRDKLCYNGQYWKIEGTEVRVVESPKPKMEL